MATFDGGCCEPCPLLLHVAAFAWVACLPTATCLLILSPAAALVCAALIAVPRVIWSASDPPSGAKFQLAMGLYWNEVYILMFLSPLFLGACLWADPWRSLPAVGAYAVMTRVHRPSLKDGFPWPWFAEREWGFHAFRRFLSFRLHVSEALRKRPAEQPVIMAVHPHGVASDYRVLMDGMLRKALPGRIILTLAASVLFLIPYVRELCLWTRCIDASRPIAAAALKRGRSLMVIPGGELEQIRTKTGREEVCLSTRVGFVRLALQNGAALVPCYAFGCVDLYTTYSALHAPREWLRKRMGICLPLYRGSVGVLPRQLPVDLVIGDPIELSCATKGAPTDEEVMAAHREYVDALRRLFDAHKERFGFKNRELEVV